VQSTIVRHPDYVAVELTGQVDLATLLELIRKLGALSREAGDTRVLFDSMNMTGDVHFGGQMQIGEQIARSMSHLARVASVMPAEKITRNSEKVARAQGVQLRVFASRDEAIEWIRADAPESTSSSASSGTSHGSSDTMRGADGPVMDPVRTAIWLAVRHLFPPHAQAIQLATGALAISWSIANDPYAVHDMATPITIRLEPELVEHMRMANAEQRKRIAANQESALRAGMMGYDPYTSVPRARVIVLG